MSDTRITSQIGTCNNEPIYSDFNFAWQEYEKQKEEFAKSNPNASDESIKKIADNIVRNKEVQKIGQYEDVEDDLGLDLGIFAKTLKYGGYIKTAFGIEKFKIRNGDIDFKGKLFYVTTEYTLKTLVFKDYGKTWALTKDELIDEKERTLPL